jgi:hypothetical protein
VLWWRRGRMRGRGGAWLCEKRKGEFEWNPRLEIYTWAPIGPQYGPIWALAFFLRRAS